jgi:hypothetical protein
MNAPRFELKSREMRALCISRDFSWSAIEVFNRATRSASLKWQGWEWVGFAYFAYWCFNWSCHVLSFQLNLSPNCHFSQSAIEVFNRATRSASLKWQGWEWNCHSRKPVFFLCYAFMPYRKYVRTMIAGKFQTCFWIKVCLGNPNKEK